MQPVETGGVVLDSRHGARQNRRTTSRFGRDLSQPPFRKTLPRGHGIKEHVERRNLAIANDDYIQASIVGCLAARAGTPGQATGGILESLRLAVRGVNEVRMCGTEITGKFVKGFTPYELAWRHIQLAILCIKLGDCRTASRRVTLAEDLLKVAL